MSFIDFLPPHSHTHTMSPCERGLRDDIRRWARRRSLNLGWGESKQATVSRGTRAEKRKLFYDTKENFCHWNLFALSDRKSERWDYVERRVVVWILIGDAHICTHCEVLFSLQLYRFFHPHPLFALVCLKNNLFAFSCCWTFKEREQIFCLEKGRGLKSVKAEIKKDFHTKMVEIFFWKI
jgi:hypothetical protein